MTPQSCTGGHRRLERAGETGYVTAEFALTLPAVVLILSFCLALISSAGVQLRATDAARAAAREAAVGASSARIASVVEQIAGPAAHVEVRAEGDYLVATVTVPLPLLGKWGDLDANARAVAVPEQTF